MLSFVLFLVRWSASQEMELCVPKSDEAIQHLKEAYDSERGLLHQNALQARARANVVSEGVFSIVKEAFEIDQNSDKSEINFYLEELASDQQAYRLENWKANCKRFPVWILPFRNPPNCGVVRFGNF
ncbi:unnamed protein product [Orchesella dallaii]|uniref:Uncharacterized protein n=1 Tax=Orchesella dallaii TaxID=48710 RepID=A0ABP1S9Y7_9HEXA